MDRRQGRSEATDGDSGRARPALTRVIPIKALETNLTYLHRCGAEQAFVVDPGSAAPVLEALERHGLSLTAILLTHHHWDHIAGAADLQAKAPCELIGVDSGLLPGPDQVVVEGDGLALGDVLVRVLATPGHTGDSVCYHVPAQAGENGVVYTGDTLFVGGCGRLLAGNAAPMWQSLQRLASLPAETLVYCGHDYTLENYEFAVSIAPGHRRLRQRWAEVQKAVEYDCLTVPSTIAQEKDANIFLLADDPQIRAVLGMPDAAPVEVFAELRSRKDTFG